MAPPVANARMGKKKTKVEAAQRELKNNIGLADYTGTAQGTLFILQILALCAKAYFTIYADKIARLKQRPTVSALDPAVKTAWAAAEQKLSNAKNSLSTLNKTIEKGRAAVPSPTQALEQQWAADRERRIKDRGSAKQEFDVADAARFCDPITRE